MAIEINIHLPVQINTVAMVTKHTMMSLLHHLVMVAFPWLQVVNTIVVLLHWVCSARLVRGVRA